MQTFTRRAQGAVVALLMPWLLLSRQPAAAQIAAVAPVASASWDSTGIAVVFPREFSPDRITMDTTVGDAFSGYEWRVILVGEREVYVSALVVPPDINLRIVKINTIAEAYRLGDLRRCVRDDITLACARPARGWVRDVDGRVEIGIADFRWLSLATRSAHPKLRLVVRRARVELWSEEVPLVYSVP